MSRPFTRRYVTTLALAVAAGFLGLIAGLLLRHRNAVWNGDELYQSVNFLLYYSRSVRSALLSLLQGRGFSFPSYTLHVGYGADVFVLLGGVLTDVFSLPSILCPGRYIEYCYVGLILLRLEFCAFAFSYYCLRRGNAYGPALVASLCYAFSGALAFAGALRHPNFLTTAAFFPLVMAGIDRVFDDESPRLFVVAMTLQLLASTYFSYMVCLAMLLYCLLRYFGGSRQRSPRDFFLLVGRFVFLLALSFAISGVTLMPRVATLLSQKRLGLKRPATVLYSMLDYLRIPTDVIGATTNNEEFFFGALGVALVLVFLACRKGFRRRTWNVCAICLVGTLAGMCIPWIGKAFNGFSYPTFRWMFVSGFCCSYVVCLTVPVLSEATEGQLRTVRILAAVFAAVALLSAFLVGPISSRVAIGIAVFLLVAGAFVPACAKVPRERVAPLLACLALVGVTSSSMLLCARWGGDYASKFLHVRSVHRIMSSKSYAAALDECDEEGLYRFSARKGYGPMRNASLNSDSCAIDFYKSNYNQAVDDFRSELGLSDDYFNFRFLGSDSRLAVEGLTGSRYFVAEREAAAFAPYGYELAYESAGGYDVWRSSHCLPLAFSTSAVMCRSAYERLSMSEKQEALLQGCVIEDDEAAGYRQVAPKLSSRRVSCTLEGGPGVQVGDGRVVVTDQGAQLSLRFEGLPDSETYLQLVGLDYEVLLPSELARARGTYDEGANYAKLDSLATTPEECRIRVVGEYNRRTLLFGTKIHPQYGGKHDWLVNLGYAHDAPTSLVLEFSHVGVYRFEDLSVVFQPVEPVADSLDALAEDGSEDVTFDGRTVTAHFDAREDGSLAVFTIPYSQGWVASVDGMPAAVVQADTAVLAVPLGGRGVHEVSLEFSSPGVREGGLVSLAGLAVGLMALVCGPRLARRRANR